MAKKAKVKPHLLRGYRRLPGSAKRVRTPSGDIISDRKYNSIVNERKVRAGKRVTSARGKVVKERLKRTGQLINKNTKLGIRDKMRQGYAYRVHVGGGNYRTFNTWEFANRDLFSGYGNDQKLKYVGEFIKL